MRNELEPEQKEVLRALVEASRGRPREERTFQLISVDQGDFIAGVGAEGTLPALPDDIEELDSRDLVRIISRGQNLLTFYVTTNGLNYDEASKRRGADPLGQVEGEFRSLLENGKFRAIYSVALERWGEAASLLWGADAQRELTTVGHKAREAMQAFATALVERHSPPDVDSRPARTVARVRAVLDMYRPRLSETHVALLDAMLAYWGTASDLVQRQEHGSEREGGSLKWEDGRRVVLQTAVVMLEVHRALEAFVEPPDTQSADHAS